MKAELEQQLNKDFPHVFYREANGRDPFSIFYFEVGDGSEPLIRKTAEKLEPLFVKQIAEDPEGFKFGYYRTSQIKEKYGILRWYLSGGTDEMYEIVSKAEHESSEVCEQCGAPGKFRGFGTGWFYTACIEHCKEEDKDNLELLEYLADKEKRK